MCGDKQPVRTKIDKLIASIENLTEQLRVSNSRKRDDDEVSVRVSVGNTGEMLSLFEDRR